MGVGTFGRKGSSSYAEKAIITSGLIFAGAVILKFIIPVFEDVDFSKTDPLEDINEHVAGSLNAEYFETSNVTINVSGDNYYVKFIGEAKKDLKTYDFAEAKYKLTESNFQRLQDEADNRSAINVEEVSNEFLETLFDVLKHSEFVEETLIEELAVQQGGEIVLNLGKPVVDEQNGTASYIVSLLKLNNNNLKVGTFKFTTSLDEELKQDAQKIYLRNKKQCNVDVLGIQTFEDVQRMNLINNHLVLDGAVYQV